MKICYIVPGVIPVAEARRRAQLLRLWAAPDTQVNIIPVDSGPASIESCYEEYISVAATARKMTLAEREGYDAAILGCAGDPGLDAMRELTRNMLVIGPGATSYLSAAMLGHRFAVLTVDDSMRQLCYDLGYRAGCRDKLSDVFAVNIPVLELAKDRMATIGKMLPACRRSITEKRVDCIVLGCMTMGFLDMADDLSAALGIPVINPAKNALHIAEALVRSRLRHSKQAYAVPPKLRDGRVKSLDELYIRG